MPLYEYTCQDCQHTFEALVFEGEEAQCPQCQGDNLERLLSVPSRPRVMSSALPRPCGDHSLPPCGSPGCRRLSRQSCGH